MKDFGIKDINMGKVKWLNKDILQKYVSVFK